MPIPAQAIRTDAGQSAIPALTADRLANDLRFRADFGLRADKPYVRNLYNDAQAARINASIADGALLTPSEHDSLVARAKAQDLVIDAVRNYIKKQPSDLYGGLYVDQRRAVVVLGVTRDVAFHARALAPRLQAPDLLHVVQMVTSMADLEALMGSIDDDESALESSGIDVSSIGIDEVDNKVLVGVASDTTQATNYFRDNYPNEPIEVDHMPHPAFTGVNYTEAPPLRGGQRLRRPQGTRTFLCTSAYVAYMITRIESGIFSTQYYLLTAGHCETDDVLQAQTGSGIWQQVDYPIGLSDVNSFVPGSSADALRIPIKYTDRSAEISIAFQMRNLVRCEEAANDDVVGEQEAMSGATTGGAVGGVLKIKKLIINAEDGHGHRVKLLNQKEADYRSQPGDSGGSVYGNRRCASQAQGIESTAGFRNGKDVSSFSHVSFVDAKMGVSILTG